MSTVFSLLSLLASVGTLVCLVIILIAAFQDELWKGFLSLLCGFYLLYYALLEYDAENKWLIVLAWIGFAILAGVFRVMSISAR